MAPSTVAGVITAVGSVLTAVSLVITSIAVLVPILRKQVVAERKLDSIHVLVNSTLTAAKDAQRAGAERELVLLTEMVETRAESGKEVTAAHRGAVLEAQERVAGLRSELADRARQTELADDVEAGRK